MAAFVNDRMRSFKSAHPEQAELTTAIITALALADELHQVRDSTTSDSERVSRALSRLSHTLAEAVQRGASDPAFDLDDPSGKSPANDPSHHANDEGS